MPSPGHTGNRLNLSLVKRVIATIAGSIAAGCIGAAEITGLVTGVADGDSLTIVNRHGIHKVRLAGIDAPELAQPFGKEARTSLRELCMFKWATVETIAEDYFGRTLARVNCVGVHANEEQIRRGMAWVFRREPKRTSPLYVIEDDARKARRGLWQDVEPMSPWEWRRANRRVDGEP